MPFTTGILIGIGETRAERIDALLAIREPARAPRPRAGGDRPELPRQAGHADGGAPGAALEDLLWTIAVARIVLGPDVARAGAAEPLYEDFPRLLDAGIDDWGGVSPVTIDHVNPEAPWPELERLAEATRRAASSSRRACRSTRATSELDRWVDPGSRRPSSAPRTRSGSLARTAGRPGETAARVPFVVRRDALPVDTAAELGEDELVRLFQARGEERQRVFAAADRLRREVCGDEVSYVVTRNIQYTNVCYFRCGFCAFSKGRLAANLRGAPYLVPLDEIVRRAREAWDRGATEVCLQGGIHPAFTGDYYASVVEAIRDECPTSTSTPSRRSRCGREPRRSGSRSRTTWRGSARRPRLASRDGRGDPGRRGAGASSARTRSRPSSGSPCTQPPTASACART